MRGRTKRRTDGQRDGDGPTDGQRDRRKDGRTDQQTDEWTRRRRTDGRMETNRRLNGETNRWGEGRDGRTDPATDQSRTGRTDGRMDGQNPPPPFTLGVQQLAEPQVLLGRVEGALQVVGGVGFGQLLEVHEIRPAGGGKRPPRTQIRRVSPQKSPPPPPQNSPIQTPTTHRCLWMRALKAKPSLQLVVKFWMFTSGYLRQGLGFGEGVSRPPP